MPENTKKCPFCAEAIHADAVKCKFCHEMLSPRSSVATAIGKPLKRLIICLSLGGLAVFLLGWLYFWIMEIPIIFIVVPAGYGIVAGTIIWFCIKYSNRDIRPNIYILLVVAMGLLAIYSNWVWTINHYYQDAFCLNPITLFEYIDDFSGERSISLRGLIVIRGAGIIATWIIEALIIMGGTLLAASNLRSRAFFCPDCERWSMTSFESLPFLFESNIDDAIAAMKKHDFSALDNIKPASPNEHYYRATIIYCPTCRRGILDLTANIVTEEKELLQQNFKLALKNIPTGKFQTDTQYILQDLPCSPEEVNRLIDILSKLRSLTPGA